ncbi:MAG: VWA domain-containing protein [Planctomycetes bacterium]|nr:VWA domain-containing protein [Planctomycetota bacterium]
MNALGVSILLLGALTWGAGILPPSSAAQRLHPAADADPLARLALRLQRLRRGEIRFDDKLAAELASLVSDARLIWTVEPARGPDAARVLLDVAGAFAEADARSATGTAAAGLREAALDALRPRVDSAFATWLAREILPVETQPLERRVAAARLLKDQTQPAVKLALLAATTEKEPRLRREVLGNLVGWHDPAVHGVFLRELQRELAGDAAAEGALAERHFGQVGSDPERRFLPDLEPLVKGGLTAGDWRVAVRAVALSRPFEDAVILPHLIEALSLWKTRGARFGHALRMQMELERELRQRSGRSFGFDADLWRRWYGAVRRGEASRGGGFAAAAPSERTQASFFGLRALSDRVVFVLDRSKSMEVGFGPAGTGGAIGRRWDEAVKQVLGFLDAIGEEARFDLVVFHDYGHSWKGGELVAADARNRAAAREWLAVQIPNGGTALRAGVESALRIDRSGSLDLAKLQADTVILLCDGDTAEGAGWVERFLLEANSRARVVFHGVQIGGSGDGTLQALARGSGGEFIQIPQ